MNRIFRKSLSVFCLSKAKRLPTMSTRKILSPHYTALLTPSLLYLGELFTTAGYDFRLVGGVVRDLLLGQPPKDIDISTSCRPEDMMELLDRAKVHYIPTGLQHGTLTVLKGGIPYEITTLRVDKITDGRRAEVEFINDWKLDALRRDFTINAMSLSLDGTLYDYFDGERHLSEKRILFVGNPRSRITEDYLRILRYFRFYGRIVPVEGQHDGDTLEAIRELSQGLEGISTERVWMEMSKIFVGNYTPYLLHLMYELGVAKYIKLPPQGNFCELERVWKAMKLRGTSLRPASLLAALTHDSSEFVAMANHWKLSNKARNVGTFVEKHRKDAYNPTTSIKHFQDMLVEKTELEFIVELLQYCNRIEDSSFIKEWVIPTMPVGGKDLIEAGVERGVKFGIILKLLKERWMESGYSMNKEELIELVKNQDNETQSKRRKID